MERETEQQLIDAYLSRKGATPCPPRQAWQTSDRTKAEERKLLRWNLQRKARLRGAAPSRGKRHA
jgi:hypothetical protein